MRKESEGRSALDTLELKVIRGGRGGRLKHTVGRMLRSEVEAGGQRLMRSQEDVKSLGVREELARRLESEMEADDWLDTPPDEKPARLGGSGGGDASEDVRVEKFYVRENFKRV